jgi:hypothetical protein
LEVARTVKEINGIRLASCRACKILTIALMPPGLCEHIHEPCTTSAVPTRGSRAYLGSSSAFTGWTSMSAWTLQPHRSGR